MDTAVLERMANRIGEFFAALPDATEGREGIVNHIQKFWEPRMRTQLFAALDAGQMPQLHNLVHQAVQQARAQLEPKT